MRHYHLLFIISLLFAAFLSPSHSQTYSHSPPPFAPDNGCLPEKLFSCGPHISDLRFPFWEDSTPNTCLTQHPGFNLTCVAGDYAVIRIEGVEFRVLHVDQRELTMNLTRNDLFLNPCSVPEIRATKMKPSYFAYNLPRVARLNLLYACSNADGDDVPSFTCSGDDDHHRVVYANETRLRSVSRQAGECREGTVGALVSRENLRRIEVGELEVIEGLKLGFEVKYMDLIKCAMDCQTTKNVHPHCRFDSHSEFQCADSGKGGTSKIKVIIAVNGLVMGALLVLCFTVYYGRRNKSLLSKSNKRDQDIEGFISNNESLTAKRYKFSEVKKMTKSFKYKLGQGGCGEVYKGELKDGRFVAVKLLNSSRSDGQEFINEVVSISRTSHVNIVTLLGFCFEGQKRALVYEFMPNGSLEKFVYSNEGASQATPNLEREKMIEIATGIARGLEYLHRGCNTRILHFDIKPHNILLDEDLRPKISDFGLAKLCSNNESCVSLLNARGTMGYIAPEVCSRNFGEVSSKSDVYSYGMMILEMVGGRKNINIGASRSSKVYFPNWIYKHIKFGSDLRMLGDMTKEQNELARKMIIVGLWCIQIAPSDRPSMSKVIEMLEGSLDSLRIPPKPTLVSSESPENSHIDLSLMDSLTTSMLYAKG